MGERPKKSNASGDRAPRSDAEPSRDLRAQASAGRANGRDVVSVLVAAPPGRSAACAAALRAARGRFATRCINPGSAEPLARAMQNMPDVVILDSHLCSALDTRMLRELRGSAEDSTWLLGWTAPSTTMTDVLVDGRFHGAVVWDSSADEHLRAVEAVLAGELWFPRRVTQALYGALRERIEAAGNDVRRNQAGGPGAADSVLTTREVDTLELVRKGLTNKQIAQRLGISPNTVKKHLAHVFEKIGVHKRRQTLG
jgi:DNA-binding NarL/FixJ family response regulator